LKRNTKARVETRIYTSELVCRDKEKKEKRKGKEEKKLILCCRSCLLLSLLPKILMIPAPVLFLLLDLSDADVVDAPNDPLGLDVEMEDADAVETMELNDGELGRAAVFTDSSLVFVFPLMIFCDEEE